MPRDGLNRFCGPLDRYDDVLGSPPQEDRFREVRSSFQHLCRRLDLEQNRFRNHDLDGLQYEFGSFDEVSSSSALTNDPEN